MLAEKALWEIIAAMAYLQNGHRSVEKSVIVTMLLGISHFGVIKSAVKTSHNSVLAAHFFVLFSFYDRMSVYKIFHYENSTIYGLY